MPRYILRDPCYDLHELQSQTDKPRDYYVQLYNLRREINDIHENMPYIIEGDKVLSKPLPQPDDGEEIVEPDVVGNTKYPFTTEEECLSNKRSAKYYISKANLMDVVKGDRSISSAFKKGISKKNKDEICKEVFKSK